MKRLICVFLTILMIAAVMTSTAVTTQAVRAPMYIGDLDHDNHMTIYDATRIQRWLVGLGELDSYRESDPSWFSEKLALFLGDVNGDGACDIIDATCIQRFVAGMTDTRIWDFSTWAYYIEDTRLYADYDSGKAAVGKPVTFHADIPYYDPENITHPTEPYTYAFYIHDDLVQERSEHGELTYTFTEAGSYTIKVVYFNALDCATSRYLWSYKVVEPYSLDQPVIVSAQFRDATESQINEGDLYVRAEGGEGDYQYMYRIAGCIEEIPEGWYKEEPVDAEHDDVITTGFIDSDVLEIPESIRDAARKHEALTITVTVRDGKGNVSEPVSIDYFIEYLIG